MGHAHGADIDQSGNQANKEQIINRAKFLRKSSTKIEEKVDIGLLLNGLY